MTFRNDLARQYRTKVSELELRRIELNRINEEFEAKMRRKEVNFHFLKLIGRIIIFSKQIQLSPCN